MEEVQNISEANEQVKSVSEAENEKAAFDLIGEPILDDLTAFIKDRWNKAYTTKEKIQEVMLDALRQRKGEYSASKLEKIEEAGGSKIFMKITDAKCRDLQSWLLDLTVYDKLPAWDLKPTPIPTIPETEKKAIEDAVVEEVLGVLQQSKMMPQDKDMKVFERVAKNQVMEKLRERAETEARKAKKYLNDQMLEAKFLKTWKAFIYNLATYPSAFIKAPVMRKKKKLYWDANGEADIREELVLDFEAPSPFDIYPQPGIDCPQDGYIFEVLKYNRNDVYNLIGVPGFNEDNIREVLQQYDDGGLDVWVQHSRDNEEREQLESDSDETFYNDDFIYILQYWGSVSGKDLIDWGMSESKINDPEKSYECCVWTIGNYIIKVEINPHPLGEKPYYKASAYPKEGSFWGDGVPQVTNDIQDMCNASARELQNNMAFASGPYAEINIERLAEEEEVTEQAPRKIYQVVNDPHGNNNAKAINYFQPSSNSNELMGIYEKFKNEADYVTGIPTYTTSAPDGAGRTSSGLSMLIGAASKGLKQIVKIIDEDVTSEVIQSLYNYDMLYMDDFDNAGDVQIVAKGSHNVAVQEQSIVRKLELLQMTANPVDMQVIGVEGRAELWREILKSLEIDSENIVPSKDKLKVMQILQEYDQKMQQLAMQAQGEQQANNVKNMQPGGEQEVGTSTVGPVTS